MRAVYIFLRHAGVFAYFIASLRHAYARDIVCYARDAARGAMFHALMRLRAVDAA